MYLDLAQRGQRYEVCQSTVDVRYGQLLRTASPHLREQSLDLQAVMWDVVFDEAVRAALDEVAPHSVAQLQHVGEVAVAEEWTDMVGKHVGENRQ
jgi:hypothetical protein